MPKEIRNPKSDGRRLADEGLLAGSAFWNDGAPGDPGPLLLREDSRNGGARDLLERTAVFGETVVQFAKKIPPAPENIRLISQLVGAATSVGANYCEADDSVSRKDFKKSIGTCRKESKEAMFFLRMVAASEESLRVEARKLWREAKELNLIFGAIWRK